MNLVIVQHLFTNNKYVGNQNHSEQEKESFGKKNLHQDLCVALSCGENHTFLQTQKGVYATGCNSHGQLGIGGDGKNQLSRHSFVMLTHFLNGSNQMPIEMTDLVIKCGWKHTLFLSCRNGQTFACGKNQEGQVSRLLIFLSFSFFHFILFY